MDYRGLKFLLSFFVYIYTKCIIPFKTQDRNCDITQTGLQVPSAPEAVDIGSGMQLSKAELRATMDKLTEDQRLEDFPTAWSILKSPMFLLMTFWTIACQGEIFFVIGIMNPWLTWLADGDTEAGRPQYALCLCFVQV